MIESDRYFDRYRGKGGREEKKKIKKRNLVYTLEGRRDYHLDYLDNLLLLDSWDRVFDQRRDPLPRLRLRALPILDPRTSRRPFILRIVRTQRVQHTT